MEFYNYLILLAGGEGFEPSQSEPESDVLPLDDPPTQNELNSGLACSQDKGQSLLQAH